MALLFLTSADAAWTLSNSNVSVYDSSPAIAAVVTIAAGVTGVTLDSNVGREVFSGSMSNYSFAATSVTTMGVYSGGVLVATTGISSNGTQLTFSNGTVTAIQTGSALTAGGLTLGGANVPTSVAAAAVVAPATINTALVSNSTGTGSTGTSIGTGTAATGQNFTLTTGADSIKLPATLTAGQQVTINGAFDVTMDKILVPVGSALPAAAPGAAVNMVSDGNVDLQWNNNGAVVTLHLVGLPVGGAAEIQLQAGVVPSVFGTY